MSFYPVINLAVCSQSTVHKPIGYSFFERLIEFYQAQIRHRVKLSAIWDGMIKLQTISRLHKALESNNRDLVIEILTNAYTTNLPAGFDEFGFSEHDKPHFAQWFSAMCNALSDCTGFKRMFNKAQPHEDTIDPVMLFDYVQRRFGFSCEYFGGGRAHGFQFESKFVTAKIIEATIVMIQMERAIGGTPKTILEIGGGFGFCANALLPKQDLEQYHSIDLPLISVVQAFIVACCHGEDSVVLEGESGKGKYLVHGVSRPKGVEYDCALNQNSIPEIDPGEVNNLIDHMEDCMASGARFVSVNHESKSGNQRRVFDFMNERNLWSQISRSPAWGRDGYLEEVWERK